MKKITLEIHQIKKAEENIKVQECDATEVQ